MMGVLAFLILLAILWPQLAAHWYAEFETHLPHAREYRAEELRNKVVRRRAKNIKRIRQNRFKGHQT